MDELTKKKILGLALHWRAEGEFWRGVPEHARLQDCADQLLKAFGFAVDDHVDGNEDDVREFTPTDIYPENKVECKDWDLILDKVKTEAVAWCEEFEPASEMTKRSIGWAVYSAYEYGFDLGYECGAQSAKTLYKRKDK